MNPHLKTVFLIISVAFFERAIAQGKETTPPLATIIQEAVNRDEGTQRALQTLQFYQTVQVSQIDKNDKVMKQQEMKMVVRPGAPDEIQILTAKGEDLPANPDEAALRSQGKRAQKQNVKFPLKDISARFTIQLVGSEILKGQPVYVLSFEPKADQPYRNQTERVLNHLHGQIRVSKRDYTILQTDATLVQPVEVAWIFAKVTTLDFHYELNNFAGGFAPAQIRTSVQVDAPFTTIRQRIKVDITQVEPRTAATRGVEASQ